MPPKRAVPAEQTKSLPAPIEDVTSTFPKFHKASIVRFKQPIQKYNPVDTKHSLEQAIRDAFVLEFGWKEDHSLLERHLVLGYIAAIASISSASYGYTHPFNYQTKQILVVGALIYFIFTTLTYLQNVFVKKDIVFMAKRANGIEAENLKVHLITDKCSDVVTITAAIWNPEKKVMRRFPIVRSLGRYFTNKGEFVSSTFMADIQSIVDAYGKKKNE